MSEFENILFDQNEVSSGKGRRKRKGGLKAKAEFEFDVSAAPIKLESFFKDMMENGPDEPDLDHSESHNSIEAPMITNVPLYNPDCHLYSGEILNATNDYLDQLDKNDLLAEEDKFEDAKVQENSPQIIEFNSVVEKIDKSIMDEKIEYKELTAKRMSVKALQMFSFSEQYSQHFHMDAQVLRSLNVDMLVDKTEASLKFLKRTGSRYFDKYYNHYKFPNESKVYQIQMNWKCRNNVGYSKILSDITMNDLLAPNDPINLKSEWKGTIFEGIKLSHIFCYFGFKFFDFNEDLMFALKHLNVINMYYPPRRKFYVKNLFDEQRKVFMDEDYSQSFDINKPILNVDDNDLTLI